MMVRYVPRLHRHVLDHADSSRLWHAHVFDAHARLSRLTSSISTSRLALALRLLTQAAPGP
jgi:hypothetical protein